MRVLPPGVPAVPREAPAVLPGAVAVLIGLAVLVIVVVPFLWLVAEHFATMAHEGAHACLASLLGFTLTGVTLEQDASGMTSYWYLGTPSAGTRTTLTSFVGYLGPSAFGLCAAKLIETGRSITVLWLAIMLLVLLLFLIRKSFGLVSVPAAIALLAVVTRNAHAGLEEVISYGLTWLLLISGVRDAVAHGADAMDAIDLAAMTRVPRQVWAAAWLAGALLAVVVGGKWVVLRS
jgi:hypothetical protein